MSSIPNSAMPHAAPAADEAPEGETMTLVRRASGQAGRLAGLARDNPRTAIAAGVVAGVAAAAIPLVRAARRKGNGAAAPEGDSAPKSPARKRAAPRKSAKKS